MYPFTVWLIIESLQFYLNIIGAIVYIATHMILREFTEHKNSDILKGIKDFLDYSEK